ncbi:LysR family transcriptional regulator [Loktanella salsilacus]|uniref:Transcriptional regulator, LysR family n=1 Tax=Loktanella salsilacus TaxID=195913 RepID=A0A1I4HLC4_9RHOB|nr:LysR family transcriptional regulator [Loktanella salsilacus]MBU0860780.1 LysR family transcriptional regulator [Alphaproteobacteria bacterium]MBU1835655.1 LysR family transcriptional regulator [Alphaproteobacteria bacterium]SFL42301.1 transcriptional regulator, LysR family [Loktanella salsilacus]
MGPTRIGIRHLRYTIAVADAGGFRSAAEALNIAQPAVSKTIQDTEKDLGFAIFLRSAGVFEITDAGRVFLDDARLTLATFERTIRASRQNELGARGHIIVGYSALATSAQISAGLDRFHKRYPGCQVEMHVMSTDAMMRNLKTGKIDIGFLLSHDSVQDPEVAQQPVWSTQIGVVVPRDVHAVTLDTLRGSDFVMGVRENWRSFRALLDAAFLAPGLTPHVVDEAWDVQVIFQRVADGRGLTFYPISAADSLPAALTILPVPDWTPQLTISMAWSRVVDTKLLQAFRDSFPK